MLSPDIIARYRALRADGIRPANARYYLTPLTHGIEWRDSHRGAALATATLVRAGFDVRVDVLPSGDMPEDELGRFTSRPGEGAIDRRRLGERYIDRGQHAYWVPPETYEDIYDGYRNTGHGKHASDVATRAWIRKVYRRACDGESGYDIRVDVSRAGIKLATEWLGLGAIDTAERDLLGEHGYLATTADDVVDEAIKAAREALADLCGCAA